MLKNLSIRGCFFFLPVFLTHRYEMYVASVVLYWAACLILLRFYKTAACFCLTPPFFARTASTLSVTG